MWLECVPTKLLRINMWCRKKPRIEPWGYTRPGVIRQEGNLDEVVLRKPHRRVIGANFATK